MNNLKELTKEQHKNAERSLFVKKLLKKQITPYEYYMYLSNQLLMYTALEEAAEKLGILKGIEKIKRKTQITKDIIELENQHGFTRSLHLNSSINYVKYIREIKTNGEKLLAHIYVRHMGDLSGGQIIKKFIHGSGNHYEFDEDVNELKEKLRSKLHDGMADEAKVCFQMINEFMKELEKYIDMESSY
jgi:heme oxygenase (biliverdin-producing, ferredoxin)